MPADEVLGELLGAYALDALEPSETVAVEQWLARDSVAAAEAARLRRAAAWIGATGALAPPDAVRTGVLARVTVAPADPALDTYRGEVVRFAALVDEIPAGAEGLTTYNGLTVRDLVAHLAAMETAVAESVGAPVTLEAPDQIDARSATFAAALRDEPLDAVRAVWRRATDAIVGWARRGGTSAVLPWAGVDASRRTVLLTRAFEQWTHADDVRRALGRPLAPPAPEALHEMASLSMHLVHLAVALQHPAVAARVRVTLTGEGGGDWVVALGTAEDPEPWRGDAPAEATIETDVVAWCRLVADRAAAGPLDVRVEGDAALARLVLEAAPAFATL